MRMTERVRMPFSDRVERRSLGPHDRPFLVTTGVMLVVMGACLALDESARRELFLGAFWPWWWVVAGLACAAYAFRPTGANLHAFSGAAATLACVGRSVQLGIALVMGEVPPDRHLRTFGGIFVFLLLGRLVNRQWRTLMPLPGDGRRADT